MNKVIFFLRLHQRALLITLATTLSVGAIATYSIVYRDAPTGPVETPPAATVTAEPIPTESHYPGRTGEDAGDGTRIYTPGPTTPAPRDMLVVARRFSEAWARPTLTNEAWLDGINEYATNDFIASLKDVDPGRVPASDITGAPEVVSSRTDQAVVDVPTDTGKLRLTLVSLVGQWWVTLTEWNPPA
jgi:hypothetical protein